MILILLAVADNLKSQSILDSNKTIKIGLEFYSGGTGAFFDSNGNRIDRRDTSMITPESPNSEVPGKQTFDYNNLSLSPNIEIQISNNFIARASVDISRYTLSSGFSYVDTLKDEFGNIVYDAFGNLLTSSKSVSNILVEDLTLIEYGNIAASYYLLREKNEEISFDIELKIPFGGHYGILDDPKPFMTDGQFQSIYSFSLFKTFGEYTVFGKIGYNQRTEGLSDQFEFYAVGSFSKIENTQINIFLRYINSLDELSPNTNFLILRPQFIENIFNAGFGFRLNTNSFFVDINYEISIWGENTWNLSLFRLNSGILLD